jgi:hypothetical protein
MGKEAQRTGRRQRKALEHGASAALYRRRSPIVRSDGGGAPSVGDAESQAALGIQGLGTKATVQGSAEPGEHLGLVAEAGAPHKSLAGALPASSRAEAGISAGGAKGAGR